MKGRILNSKVMKRLTFQWVNIMKEMPLIYSRIFPVRRFYAMNLFGYILRRNTYKGDPVSLTTKNHEGIHTCQAEDFVPNKDNKAWKQILGYIIFYIIYVAEWAIKGIISIFTGFRVRAYMSISFEQEAHINDTNYSYQKERSRWD